MAGKSYLPSTDQSRVVWLNHFSTKLPTHQAVLNLTPADLASVEADAAMWSYLVGWCETIRTRSAEITAYKKQLRDGPAGITADSPEAPASPGAPATVNSDIFGRIGLLVQRIKSQSTYIDSIGEDLGIIAAGGDGVDPSTAKPVIKLNQEPGGVKVGWAKRGLSGVRIESDRGPGWQFLAIDTVPDYLDTTPRPPAGQSVAVKYRAMYLQGDEAVGEWSDVATIAVLGN